MTRWDRIGHAIGSALATVFDPLIGDRVRAHYAEKYGTCRGCGSPLGGESPEKICVDCHASEVLAKGLGGDEEGEA